MNRRKFLAALGLGAAGTALPVALTAKNASASQNLTASAVPGGMPRLTRLMLSTLDRDLRQRGIEIHHLGDFAWSGQGMGDRVRVAGRDVQLVSRSWVEVDQAAYHAPDEEALHRYLNPAASALANDIEYSRLNVFAPLPIPAGIEHAQFGLGGLWLRGLRDYSIDKDRIVTRFDVLGGCA